MRKSNAAKKSNAKPQLSNTVPAKTAPEQKANEAQIAVHWKEEESLRTAAGFIGQPNLVDPAVIKSFGGENLPECFGNYGDFLDWDKSWHTPLDTEHPPFWKWCVGGKLNVCYNGVAR